MTARGWRARVRRWRVARLGARVSQLVPGFVIVVLVSFLFAGVVQAEEALSPEALEIANQLNCPVCQGQSVRDSNSELARQMRQLIQQKLDAGESREEILQYFVDRYGVSVLREPPRQGYFWVLWWGPVVGLVGGILLLVLYFRRRDAEASGIEEPVAPEELRRVEQFLEPEGRVR